jgi:hypothetical protein
MSILQVVIMFIYGAIDDLYQKSTHFSNLFFSMHCNYGTLDWGEPEPHEWYSCARIVYMCIMVHVCLSHKIYAHHGFMDIHVSAIEVFYCTLSCWATGRIYSVLV